MSDHKFHFKQFSIQQDRCAMKVGIDAVLLGAAADAPSFCYHALDIGTGTGLLALMLAQRLPSTEIDAVEIDAAAAAQAAENVANSRFAERVTVYHGRIQRFRPNQTYDLILCNPPYFTDGVASPDPARQQARHADALPHRELLAAVTRLLNPTGKFWLILPFAQHGRFVREAADFHLKPSQQLRICPRPDKAPNRVIMQFERIGKRLVVENITVRGESGQAYTEQFRSLTAEFYQ